jgi:hypothetical protein
MTEEGQPGTEPTGTEPPLEAEAPSGAEAPSTVEPSSGSAPEPLPPVSMDTEPYVPAAPAAAAPVYSAPAPPTPAAPVPPVGWQAPPVVVAAKGERTTLALAAGILLILGGIAGILIGLLVAIVGGSVVGSIDFSQFNNSPDLNGANPGALATGVVAFVGAVVVAYSIAYLLAGVGVVRSSNWARVLGIILGVISGLVWLSGVANANHAQNVAGASGGGILFSVLALGVHVYIVVALLFFWRNRPSVA